MSSKEINTKKDGRWKIGSVNGLWDDIIITVSDGYIVGCNLRNSVEIGSLFEPLRKYWEAFEGENKYLIQKINDE